MKVLSFLCILLVSVATAKQQLSELQYRNAFTNWMISNEKAYTSEEFAHRYGVFKSNMDYVNDWNSKGSETVLGLNVFADITNQEYRSNYLSTPFDVSSIINSNNAEIIFSPTIAASVDWRNSGAVTPIKNQGECQGCWSFSAVGSTEGAHQIATKNLVSLSEQNLLDCSSYLGNQGCAGGLITTAFEYIILNGGIDTESSYEFQGQDGTCNFNPNNIGATLSSYLNVTSGSEASLASAANINPVSVGIDASHNSFQLYQSGIYYEPACSKTNLDHGVLVVGYGSGSAPSTSTSTSSSQGLFFDNPPQFTPWHSITTGSSQSQSSQSSQSGSGGSGGSGGPGGPNCSGGSVGSSGQENLGCLLDDTDKTSENYYIVKNSWGTGWGLNGYVLMSKDRNNNCGIATRASFPQV